MENMSVVQQMKDMDFHSKLSSVTIGTDNVSLDDISKQKVMNHFDDNMAEEEVQLKSDVSSDIEDFES
jgi:hypothetical protein